MLRRSRLELEVEQAGIVGRRPDGAGHVQFLGPALASEPAQAPKGQLHAPRAELDLAVEVAELALLPNLDCAAMARSALADPHPLGVVAEGPEGRRACRADPFRAALVPALLLGQALAQGLHELVPTAQRLDGGHLLGRQQLFGQLLQPFLGQLGDDVGADRLQAPEEMGEDPVEPVHMPFVLHQGGAGEKIEALDAGVGAAGLERAQQGQVFGEGGGNSRGAELGDEAGEHRALRLTAAVEEGDALE